MNGETQEKKDCEVCERLMREKHKKDIFWKIACLLLVLIAAVFIGLYFSSGKNEVVTEIKLDGAVVETNGDDNNINIGGEQTEVRGTITQQNNTPIICLTVLGATVILVIGGTIIAVSQGHKKDNTPK